MSKSIALFVFLLVAWNTATQVRADDTAAGPPALPPAVNESPAEKEIEAALRRPVTLEFKELSLADACAKITKQVGIEVRLDQKALADAAIDPAVTVTIKVTGIPLAYALESWLSDFELDFIVRDDVLLITSKEYADGYCPTRIYPVDDLITDRDRSRQTFSALPNSKLIHAPHGWALVHSGNRGTSYALTELLTEIRATKEPRRASPDAEIEAALKKPIQLDLKEESLADTADKIAKASGLEIRLDHKALADAAIDSAVLVTFKNEKPMGISAALNVMLAEFELTHVIHHGHVRITSKEKADNMQVWRAYLVDDLVRTGPAQQVNFGPLIQMIEDEIAPDSWDTNGGVGSIKPLFTPWGCLIAFRNTRQVHALTAALLADLRAVKQLPGAVERPPINPKARYMVVYYLGEVAGPELVKILSEAIAPESWQGQGGAGRMWAVSSTDAKTGGTSAQGKSSDSEQTIVTWQLIVSQTPDVHRQLAELIPKLTGKASLGFGMSGHVGVIESVPPIPMDPKDRPAPSTNTNYK